MNDNDIKTFIKDHFKNVSRKLNERNASFFFKSNLDVKKYCEDLLKAEPLFQTVENVLNSILFDEHLKRCKTCGKKMAYSKICYDFCSRRCAAKNKDTQKKAKETCLKRYGVAYSSQNEEIKRKD